MRRLTEHILAGSAKGIMKIDKRGPLVGTRKTLNIIDGNRTGSGA